MEVEQETHIVDRNAVTATVLRFLLEMPEAADGRLTAIFNTRLRFVDGRNKIAYISATRSATRGKLNMIC